MKTTIKATFILKDFSESFYNGFEWCGERVMGLNELSDAGKFEKLNAMARESRVSVKIGNGSFRDRIELNTLTKAPHLITFKIEPRRGYKLATFIFSDN